MLGGLAARDGAVGGQEHLVGAKELQHRTLRQEGMVFDLIAQQIGAVPFDRFLQQCDGEVADADVARLALGLDLGQRLQAVAERDLGVGPVDQQQIDMIGPQLFQAFIDRALKIAGSDPLVPDLGREENFVTRDA